MTREDLLAGKWFTFAINHNGEGYRQVFKFKPNGPATSENDRNPGYLIDGVHRPGRNLDTQHHAEVLSVSASEITVYVFCLGEIIEQTKPLSDFIVTTI